MTQTTKKGFSFNLRRAVFGPQTAVDVLERSSKPLSDAYLDALQQEIDSKLGPASERKPAGPSGW